MDVLFLAQLSLQVRQVFHRNHLFERELIEHCHYLCLGAAVVKEVERVA